EFVTRKITLAAAKAKLDPSRKLKLGNLEARRDWGFAGDYVRAMWMMLQQEKAEDYVIATGEMHTVQDVAELAYAHVGLDWKDHVVVDKGLFRPAEVDQLMGDASKAKKELGWEPEVSFEDLIRTMVDADLERVKAEKK
ncbi:MAG: GDP-mannose 4,6-dehydratase, partial [Planctomycetota bacterium]|nr:GDP-mannose 4,6-dehydratase [Planctomycetota bacterium]